MLSFEGAKARVGFPPVLDLAPRQNLRSPNFLALIACDEPNTVHACQSELPFPRRPHLCGLNQQEYFRVGALNEDEQESVTDFGRLLSVSVNWLREQSQVSRHLSTNRF